MNGAELPLDTNICIYLPNGDVILSDLLQNQAIFISIISEMELSAYHGNNTASLQSLKDFFNAISIINIGETIKNNAIELRRTYKLKLPDAIIGATALAYDCTLISADKAFAKVKSLDLFLYEKDKF